MASFDPSRARQVLAPFDDRGPHLEVGLEDAHGDLIAGTGVTTGSEAPRLTRELRLEGTIIGRLVASGVAAGEPAVADALEALARSFEQLADAERRALDDRGRSGGDERSSLASELALGRLQQRTLVSLVAPDVAGYDLASHYEPAREIGGDFFELFRLRRRGHPLGIVIADVAGKGIGAAVLMAFSRPVIHTALSSASGPADALERTNRILVYELRTALFITALVGRLDVRTGILRLANAGHERPILIPDDGGPIVVVEGGGPLLGAFSPLRLDEITVELRPGDQLLLYTDGVTDARGPSGERFGKLRLMDAVEHNRGGTATDLVAAIRDSVAAFAASVEPADDVAIVAVGRHRAR